MTLDSIPLTHAAVISAMNIIPVAFHEDAWIAGSAAARWSEAWAAGGDLDIWVVGPHDEIEAAMQPEDRLVPRDDGPHPVDPGYAESFRFLHVSDRLHIMSSAEGIVTILAGFDISCHAAAIPILGGEPILHSQYSRDVEVLPGAHDAKVTLKRVMKFSTRYRDEGVWEREGVRRCAGEAFGGVIVPKSAAALMAPEGM